MMKQLFTCGDRAQDLIYWAEKIEAIGSAISVIDSFDGDSKHVLGDVICDYAEALKTVLSVHYSDFCDAIGNAKSMELVEIEQEYSRIKNLDQRVSVTDDIQKTLEKVQEFKAKVSSIFDIEADLKNRLSNNPKKNKENIIKEAV
nr:hypothetical protein [Desulfobacula sp.]